MNFVMLATFWEISDVFGCFWPLEIFSAIYSLIEMKIKHTFEIETILSFYFHLHSFEIEVEWYNTMSSTNTPTFSIFHKMTQNATIKAIPCAQPAIFSRQTYKYKPYIHITNYTYNIVSKTHTQCPTILRKHEKFTYYRIQIRHTC